MNSKSLIFSSPSGELIKAKSGVNLTLFHEYLALDARGQAQLNVRSFTRNQFYDPPSLANMVKGALRNICLDSKQACTFALIKCCHLMLNWANKRQLIDQSNFHKGSGTLMTRLYKEVIKSWDTYNKSSLYRF